MAEQYKKCPFLIAASIIKFGKPVPEAVEEKPVAYTFRLDNLFEYTDCGNHCALFDDDEGVPCIFLIYNKLNDLNSIMLLVNSTLESFEKLKKD